MSFVERFRKIMEGGRLPYVLLLHGKEMAYLAEEASLCAKVLLGATKEFHLDLHHLYPEGKTGMHSLHAVQTLCHQIYLASTEGGYKCFIIHHAERMLPSNANALLKTFEEPPPNSLIFLLTSKPALILPTIRSRSHEYAVQRSVTKEWSALEQEFLEILVGKKAPSELGALCDKIDKERKEQEAEGLKQLPKESTPQQKELMTKAFEGKNALRYQQQREGLLEVFLTFHRDLTFYHAKAAQQELYFPHLIDLYEKKEPRDLELVEQLIRKVTLAHERGMKLQHALEVLL